MTLSQFTTSLNFNEPPKGLNILLQALWYDAKGDWKKAHELAQDVNTPDGSWVHGYLHLREGDRSNASYWYNHAGRSLPSADLETEWRKIASELIN